MRRTERLEISTTEKYVGIRQEVHAAIRAVIGRPAHQRRTAGAVIVASYGLMWPVYFPQHGSGKKHLRKIELAPWQVEIALDRNPGQLVRGLVHSDGSRSMNCVESRGRQYAYPRYTFCNESADIRAIFDEACGRLGVETRPMGPRQRSVAKRELVELLDQLIGPKY